PEIAERPAAAAGGEPAPGYVRVYHAGDVDPASGGGRWASPDPAWVRHYRHGSQVFYADIPESSPLLRKAFDDTGTGQREPYVPFEMPEDLARTLRPIEELSGAGEPPGGGMRPETAFEPPPDETGPYGQRPAFRKYPGLGEALTGEEIGPQLGADTARMTRPLESVDRECGDVFDEPTRDRLKQQIRDNQARFEYLGRGKQTIERTQGLGRALLFDLECAQL